MDLSDITGGLPYGVVPFSALEGRLLDTHNKKQLPPGARDVLMVLFPYYLGEEAYLGANVARYAVSADYHSLVNGRLDEICERLAQRFPNDRFAAFADNSPLPEKYAALLAGLGVRGKNTLLIHERYGSYCFVGGIVSTADLGGAVHDAGECLNCLACVRACPSGALRCDGSIAVERCLSAITQKKGDLTPEERSLVKQGGLVWGCDRCQTVCPMNRDLPLSPLAECRATAKTVYAKGDSLLWRSYAWRGAAVLERNYAILYEDGDVQSPK